MPRIRSTLDDLRHALRTLRRSPGAAAAALLTLAFGIGVGLPLTAAARAGMSAEPAVVPPAFARTAAGGWTESLRTVEQMQHQGLNGALLVVLGAALLVLAGTCVNVSALALARASARRHETAMRAVLGADPRRLATGAAAELGVLVAGGGGAGVIVGLVVLGLLRATWPGSPAPWLAAAPDVVTLAIAAGIPAIVLLAGVLPVLRTSRGRLYDELAVGSRATPGRHEGWVRRTITIAQFAGSMMLLVGAGVLVRGSAPRPGDAGSGFDPRDTLTLRLEPPAALRGDPAGLAAFYAAAVARARQVPGVRAATFASPGAWLGLGPQDDVTTICPECSEGGLVVPVLHRPTRHHAADAGYFAALGIPVLEGRLPRPGAREVVLNRAAASHLFPGAGAVGQTLMPDPAVSAAASLFPGWKGAGGESASRYTVVGVVGDVQPAGFGSPAGAVPALYLPAGLLPPTSAAVAVRTAGDPRARAATIEAALLSAAPGARVGEVATMEEALALHRAPLAWFAGVLAALAGFAVLLSSSGVYAVVAFGVARRTREIGVRMALGAQPGQVVRHVVAGGLRVARTGAILGALGALGVARTLQLFFRGVDPADVTVYTAVAGLLAVVAVLASWLPARRAARVDPNVALQSG